MLVNVSIFGFGDDRPACFVSRDKMHLTLQTAATAHTAMQAAGFIDTTGLVLMINNTVVSEQDWSSTLLKDGDDLRILSAFEGG